MVEYPCYFQEPSVSLRESPRKGGVTGAGVTRLSRALLCLSLDAFIGLVN